MDEATVERFWSKVFRYEGCWNWTGCLERTGYGRFKSHGRKHSAHRVAYELVNGHIPDGLWVLHRCDNRRCVNPDHLFLGTPQDNVLDMLKKSRHGQQKLNYERAAEMRRDRLAGLTYAELGKKYSVSGVTAYHTAKGTYWKVSV
jgi:hypothetical protein